MAKMLSRCPVCEGALSVSELACGRCSTRVKSVFDPCRFCSLSAEHLGFIEIFLRCEGNLSRVEKELGLSYPTVRNRLTNALNALGMGAASAESAASEEAAINRTLTPEEITARRSEALNALAAR